MNKKFFHRRTGERQLEQLYREADRGVPLQSVEPHLLKALARVQGFRRYLLGLASEVEPSNPRAVRATLLATVERRKSELAGLPGDLGQLGYLRRHVRRPNAVRSIEKC